ncbi:MAG: hypothetical protein ACFFKA_00480 [Candidatus Thorarchaeota archaeon]
MNEFKLSNANNQNLEEIGKIRVTIRDLEINVNEIITVLRSDTSLDQNYVEIVVSNIKDCYYLVVMALEKLNSELKKKGNDLDNSKESLYFAKSRLMQSISELRILDNNELPNLISRLKKVFEICWNSFFNVYKTFEPLKKKKFLSQKVLELSETMYQLPCSVCGKIAVEFKIGYGRFDEEESLVFRGITHSRSLRRSLSTILFEILKAKNLSGIHEFMKQYHGYEGLDAYCPQCDKIYCWEHYNATEEWEEGFYDCTYGTCPKGHRRMIDD